MFLDICIDMLIDISIDMLIDISIDIFIDIVAGKEEGGEGGGVDFSLKSNNPTPEVGELQKPIKTNKKVIKKTLTMPTKANNKKHLQKPKKPTTKSTYKSHAKDIWRKCSG